MLPAGYEARVTAEGRRYYVDHVSQTTSWELPAVAQPVAVAAPVAKPPVAVAAPVAPEEAQSVPQSQEQPPSAKAKKAGAATQVWSRTSALAQSAVLGPLAPSRLSKRGVLVLDGVERWVELKRGILTIYETKDKDFLRFRAPLKFIRVVGDRSTRQNVRRGAAVAENEILLDVDPDLMNKEADHQNSSRIPFGWFDHLRVGAHQAETGLSGPEGLERQHFSLFAKTPTEKQSWRITLHSAASSLRNWAYAGHEVRDSWKYISGKKK